MSTGLTAITIDSISIKQDAEGRFCLNDFHKASGGAVRHRPAEWLKLSSTAELAEELDKEGIPSIRAQRRIGTYVVKELVYAYAMWISPKFHLKVIRTYDQVVTTVKDGFELVYFKETPMRVINRGSSGIWFIAAEVFRATPSAGAPNPTHFLGRHITPAHKGTMKVSTHGGFQDVRVVSLKGAEKIALRINGTRGPEFMKWASSLKVSESLVSIKPRDDESLKKRLKEFIALHDDYLAAHRVMSNARAKVQTSLASLKRLTQ